MRTHWLAEHSSLHLSHWRLPLTEAWAVRSTAQSTEQTVLSSKEEWVSKLSRERRGSRAQLLLFCARRFLVGPNRQRSAVHVFWWPNPIDDAGRERQPPSIARHANGKIRQILLRPSVIWSKFWFCLQDSVILFLIKTIWGLCERPKPSNEAFMTTRRLHSYGYETTNQNQVI